MTYRKIFTIHAGNVEQAIVQQFVDRTEYFLRACGATHTWVDLQGLPDIVVMAEVPDHNKLGEGITYAEILEHLPPVKEE